METTEKTPEEKAAELWEAWKKDGQAGIRRIAEARDREYQSVHLSQPESQEGIQLGSELTTHPAPESHE